MRSSAERPDWTLVYGDTASTLAGARAAREAAVPLAHVESGMRSGDWSMPEEHIRVEVDRISTLLLCPDKRSAQQLEREEVEGRIEVVGDVMADACFRLAPIARDRSNILERLGLAAEGYAVATVHREANVQQPRLGRIVDGLNRLTERVIFPRTHAPARPSNRKGSSSRPTSVSSSRSATSTSPRSPRVPA